MSRVKAYLNENLILVIAFIAALVLEAAVVFPIMCGDYLNYDSSYQYALTQHTLPEIWRLLPYDYSPPFYAIALKLYCMVFGSSLLAMRSFSLFAIFGIYFISTFPMNTLFGKKAALICLTLTFTIKNVLLLSNEIRPTIFAFFFFEAVAVYAGIVFSKGKRYSYICLTVFSVLAMYTHNVALVGAFSVYVVLLLFMLITGNWKKFRNVLISGCICGVLYLPWLRVILSQISNVSTHYWQTPSGFSDSIYWVFTDYKKSYAGFIIPELVHLAVIIIVLIALFKHVDFKKIKGAKNFNGLFHLAQDKSVYINILFLLLCIFFSIAIMEMVSTFIHNIRSERYYYIFAMAWMVILSAIVGRFGNKVWCVIFAVLMITNHAINVAYIKSDIDNSDMGKIVEEIKRRSPDGDIEFVHFHEYSLGIMYYYFPDAKHYVCNETFTVLGTYDVFSSNVIDIGSSIDNIWNYTDSFYMFKNKWGNSDEQIFLVDALERMNDNEIVDIRVYRMGYEVFAKDFELAEAVYTGEKAAY